MLSKRDNYYRESLKWAVLKYNILENTRFWIYPLHGTNIIVLTLNYVDFEFRVHISTLETHGVFFRPKSVYCTARTSCTENVLFWIIHMNSQPRQANPKCISLLSSMVLAIFCKRVNFFDLSLFKELKKVPRSCWKNKDT